MPDEGISNHRNKDKHAVEQLYLSCSDMISGCARRLCRQYNCLYLLDDLVSEGGVTFFEKLDGYDESRDADLATYIQPHIIGAMRREIEANISCMKIPKRELNKIRKAHAVYNRDSWQPQHERIKMVADALGIKISEASLILAQEVIPDSVDELFENEESTGSEERLFSKVRTPHELVFWKICIEYFEEAFLQLSFKEREFIGGYYGVFGMERRTLADIGEQFLMDENGAIKARDKALKKLATLCMDGKLGIWREVYSAVMRAAKG